MSRGFVFSFEVLDTILPKMVLSHSISLCYMLQQELLPFFSQGLLLGTPKTQLHAPAHRTGHTEKLLCSLLGSKTASP